MYYDLKLKTSEYYLIKIQGTSTSNACDGKIK